MTSSIAVVADADTVVGFRLGGIKEGYVVGTTEEAKEALTKLIKENTSIIIITEKIGDELKEVIEKFTKSSALPIIIEIPDKHGSAERAADPMMELIKRVIGVEMVK